MLEAPGKHVDRSFIQNLRSEVEVARVQSSSPAVEELLRELRLQGRESCDCRSEDGLYTDSEDDTYCPHDHEERCAKPTTKIRRC